MRLSARFTAGAIGAAAVLLTATSAFASPFDFIRIGDLDGFGFASTGSLVRSNGAAADTNGNNLLQVTEFLPDLNRNGSVATGSGDDFDNRSAAELLNTVIQGNGFTDTGSTGSNWTDMALSTSNPSAPPDGNSAVPNNAVFTFSFHVNGADVTGADLFFNVLFGDYDVVPANITLSFASAASRNIALATQPAAADGLIQAAFTNLFFNEVFTADGSGGWNGFLRVNFIAPNEPFTAFDFAELSTTAIATNIVPEPGTLVLFGTGALGLVAARLRRKR